MKVRRFSAVLRVLETIKLVLFKLVTGATIGVLIAVSSIYTTIQNPQPVEALDSARMLLFWDGGAAPSSCGGWTDVSSDPNYANKFPRGEAAANVLQTGGATTHTHTDNGTFVNNFVVGGGNTTVGNTIADINHSHLTSPPVVSSASNEPFHRTLKLIRADGGIPTCVPAGAIALFDNTAPTGWTRQSAQDGRMLKIGTTIADGGSDTHNHTITWDFLDPASNPNQHGQNAAAGAVVVPNTHGHAAPAPSTTSTESNLPPHVKPILAKADSTITAPDGMIAMFDANPGGGWAIQSNPGGSFYQQFMRPAATFDGNSVGTLINNHPSVTSGQTATPVTPNISPGNSGTNTATASHYHTVTANFGETDHTPPYVNVVIARKALPSMLLFWDGAVAPSGWSFVTEFNGRFPRGESPGNYGDVGPAHITNLASPNHSHTLQSVTMSGPSAEVAGDGGEGAVSSNGHTHSLPSATIATASSVPQFRSLKLIRSDNGIPNVLPSGGITIFDNSPGIPTKEISPGNPLWTRVTVNDNLVIKVDSAVGTGGPATDNHSHNVTFGAGGLGLATAATQRSCLLNLCGNGNPASPTGHTHTLSTTAGASTTGTSLPPFTSVLLAKLNADTATLSVGITAMFSGDPGSGWSIRSSAGGPYYKRFLRPAATYAQAANLNDLCAPGFGCDYHTHSRTLTTGAATGGGGGNAFAGTQASRSGHTHQVTANYAPGNTDALYTANNDYFAPPYFNVVIAEKVDFSLKNYAWYEDSNTLTVTDRWSVLDVAQDTAIPTLPTAYKPPDLGMELRLRVRLLVNNNDLLANDISYRLQYKEGSDGSCTTGTWLPVGAGGGSEVWRFADSSITDGSQLIGTSVFLVPASVLQVYSKSNPTASNPNLVPTGQTMEYDFHIQHNGAKGATQYSFRIVEDGDILLSEYEKCPTLVTKPQSVNQLRHGEFFESGNERGFSWVD